MTSTGTTKAGPGPSKVASPGSTAVPRVSVGAVRQRYLDLGLALTRMVSATQLLTRVRTAAGLSPLALTAAFAAARTTMLEIDRQIDGGQAAEAAEKIALLELDVARLGAIVLDADREMSVRDLQSYLAHNPSVPVDLLTRALDFYSRLPSDRRDRKKTIALATAVALRHADDDPPVVEGPTTAPAAPEPAPSAAPVPVDLASSTVDADADADADAMLNACRDAIAAAVAGGADTLAALQLDEGEIEATTGPDGESPLIAAAAHRLAVQQLAQRQTGGVSPTARAFAGALLRRATPCESAVRARSQTAILSGQLGAAKIYTRAANRLAEARLELASMTGQAATGLAPVPTNKVAPTLSSSSAAVAAAPAPDPTQQLARAQHELAAAKLMRAALRDTIEIKSGELAGRTGSWSGQPARERSTGRSAADPLKARASARRHRVLLTVLALSICAAAVYHLTALTDADPISHELPSPIELSQTNVAGGTFIATTVADWAGMESQLREDHLRALWQDAAARGYSRLVLVHASSPMPLGYASAYELRVVDNGRTGPF